MRASLAAITFYQRYVSPHKGFRCAFGVYHDTESCSAKVKAIISESGLIKGGPAIISQFKQCRVASIMLAKQIQEPSTDKAVPESDKEKKKKKKTGDPCCFLIPGDLALCSGAEASTGVCGLGEGFLGACSCL